MGVEKEGQNALSVRVLVLIDSGETALVKGRHSHRLDQADALESERFKFLILHILYSPKGRIAKEIVCQLDYRTSACFLE
jgi:hypothetical protein